MKIKSESAFFGQAIATGMPRAHAATLAHLAYWDQFAGGQTIAGEVWKYRTVGEIGLALGYGARTVTRAIVELKANGLIDSRTMWDPRCPGRRVNGYRLLARAKQMLPAEAPKSVSVPNRKRHDGGIGPDKFVSSDGPLVRDRVSANGAAIDNITTRVPIIEQVTPASLRENQFKYLEQKELQEEKLDVWFADYIRCKSTSSVAMDVASKVFWECLATAVSECTGRLIEPWDKTVGQRVLNYLKLFDDSRNCWLGPLDSAAFALWAAIENRSFQSMIADVRGSSNQSSEINSYQLEKYGFLIINRVNDMRISAEREDRAVPAFLGGGFK